MAEAQDAPPSPRKSLREREAELDARANPFDTQTDIRFREALAIVRRGANTIALFKGRYIAKVILLLGALGTSAALLPLAAEDRRGPRRAGQTHRRHHRLPGLPALAHRGHDRHASTDHPDLGDGARRVPGDRGGRLRSGCPPGRCRRRAGRRPRHREFHRERHARRPQLRRRAVRLLRVQDEHAAHAVAQPHAAVPPLQPHVAHLHDPPWRTSGSATPSTGCCTTRRPSTRSSTRCSTRRSVRRGPSAWPCSG